jgi:hypothetical protein
VLSEEHDMADDRITKPTIETILEMMIASDERFQQRFDQLEKITDGRFDQFERRFDQFEKRTDERFERLDEFENRTDERFDRLEKEFDRLIVVTHSTKADMSELRLGFRELRTQVNELLPIPRE